MKRLKCIYPIVLIGVFSLSQMLATEAFAQEKNPCSDDLAKFCPEVKSGDRAGVMNCLEWHETELSDACRAYEGRMGGSRVESREMMRQRRAILQACKDDVTKFCKDVDPLKGGYLACLGDHEKELSPPCGESLRTLKGEMKKTP